MAVTIDFSVVIFALVNFIVVQVTTHTRAHDTLFTFAYHYAYHLQYAGLFRGFWLRAVES